MLQIYQWWRAGALFRPLGRKSVKQGPIHLKWTVEQVCWFLVVLVLSNPFFWNHGRVRDWTKTPMVNSVWPLLSGVRPNLPPETTQFCAKYITHWVLGVCDITGISRCHGMGKFHKQSPWKVRMDIWAITITHQPAWSGHAGVFPYNSPAFGVTNRRFVLLLQFAQIYTATYP